MKDSKSAPVKTVEFNSRASRILSENASSEDQSNIVFNSPKFTSNNKENSSSGSEEVKF
tara:strand:- start:248 stop:424 length:177 start_codon:yes stop_codon:yes gene_type:complete